MIARLLKIVVLTFPLCFPAFAETNLAGEEIIIQEDTPGNLTINPAPLPDPVLTYLPRWSHSVPSLS